MKPKKLMLVQLVLALLVHRSSFGQMVALQPSSDEMTRALESIASNQISVRVRAKAHMGGTSKRETLKRVGVALLQAAEQRATQQAPGLWREAYTQATPGQLPIYGGSTYNASSTNAYSADAFSARQFGRLRSADGTVSVAAPSDWRPGTALEDGLQACSPRGETFSYAKLDVYVNPNAIRFAVRGLQMMGANPRRIALVPRLVSPPLRPTEVVQRLLPQISGGAIQNVQITGSQALPQGGALVSYRYVLLPRRDALFASWVNPVLRNETQVPMQAQARIYVTPGINADILSSWTLLYQIVDAPQATFGQDVAIYQRIMDSFAFDPNALRQRELVGQQMVSGLSSSMAQQNQMVRDWSNRMMKNQTQQLQNWQDWNEKQGQAFIDMAGGEARYADPNDPGWQGTTSWGDIPYDARPYRCPLTSDPVQLRPGQAAPSGCTPLQPYKY